MLEGDMVKDSCYTSTSGSTGGSKSGRMWPELQQQHQLGNQILRQASEILTGNTSHEALRIAWDRERKNLNRRC